MKLLEFTKHEKIAILKDAIDFIKCNRVGMCQALGYGVDVLILKHTNNHSSMGIFNIEYTFPNFTHRNYVLFYPLSWNVYKHRNYAYWDNNLKRRSLFLKYLLLRTYLSK